MDGCPDKLVLFPDFTGNYSEYSNLQEYNFFIIAVVRHQNP